MSNKKLHILFVCTGNICRSPTAEGILKKILPMEVKDKFVVQSAGTNALEGMKASAYAVEVAKNNGIPLSDHNSKQANGKMLSQSHLVFVMSNEHIEYFKRYFPKYLDKIYALKKFNNPDADDTEIEDPIGGSIESYEERFNEIKSEIERILPELIKLIEEK